MLTDFCLWQVVGKFDLGESIELQVYIAYMLVT